MNLTFLQDLILLMVLAVAAVLLFHRLRLPSAMGLLTTGIVAGPYGLGWISHAHEVEVLAEFGVVLLLFSIGLEFSFARLVELRRWMLGSGVLQVGLVFAAVYGLASGLLELSMKESLFLGGAFALSSTALVLKALQDHAELETPHGRATLGVLVFQDVAAVLMLLLVPLLGASAEGTRSSWWILPILLALGGGLAVSSRVFLPRLLHHVVASKIPELFPLTVIGLCLGIAWLTAWAGFSLALGAFLAGVMVAESEFSHDALDHILPSRDVFTSFFFISVGMLLNPRFVWEYLPWVLGATMLVIVLKSILGAWAAWLSGADLAVSLKVGLLTAQIGEFAFLLDRAAGTAGLRDDTLGQGVLSVTVLSMIVAALMLPHCQRWAEWMLRAPWPLRLRLGWAGDSPEEFLDKSSLQDHLVVVGYGLNGKNVARAARRLGVPYAVIEANPETVRRERAEGVPILYGDASRKAVLERARVQHARTVVVVIAIPTAVRRITEQVRALNPAAHVIVRTRYVAEIPALTQLGANEVIPEEFETSLEIFRRVMSSFLAPRPDVEHCIAELRKDQYGLLRHHSTSSVLSSQLSELEVTTWILPPDSPACGQTLAELGLRRALGLTVLAVQRSGQVLFEIGPETSLQAEDQLFLLGTPERLAQAFQKPPLATGSDILTSSKPPTVSLDTS
ncbi:MAG: cation:proton antiporter [bacterium]